LRSCSTGGVSYRGDARYAFDLFRIGDITAWNPRIGYEFMSNLGLLRGTQRETIWALTD
jgi:hypothetical protein